MKLGRIAIVVGLALGLMQFGASAQADVQEGIKHLEAKEFGKAFIAFEKAVTDGDPTGLYYMGAMHQAGLGVPKSEKMAYEFFKPAASAGVPEAAFAVGVFHHRGKGGLLKNPGHAVDWYKVAADKGSIGAQYNLAMMYATGEASELSYGSNPVPQKAYKWFLIVLDSMETKYDVAHITDRLEELKRDMTPGQLKKAKEEAKAWLEAKKSKES